MASTLSPLYPWQQTLWRQFQQSWQQQRLPHALLLHGADGMGKQAFANNIAAALLCQQPKNQHACGQCTACHWLATGNHLDYLIYQADIGKALKIDDIRQLLGQALLTPRHGRYQIFCITPADAMNRAAANALLKILEEPPAQTLLLLLSAHHFRLLPTVRSRCQSFNFDRCEKEPQQHWLAQQTQQSVEQAAALLAAAKSPLQAVKYPNLLLEQEKIWADWQAVLQQRQDMVSVALSWAKTDVEQVLDCLSAGLMLVIRQRMGLMPATHLLMPWANQCSISQLFTLLQLIWQQQQTLQQQQLKPQTALEAVLLASLNPDTATPQ